MKSAQSSSGVGAKPRDWIVAQFAGFDEYQKWAGRALTPQPAQLHGLNATARYIKYMREEQEQRVRDDRKLVTVASFKLDERNLKALCRSLRMPEVDVIVEQPDQFSIPFLKERGLYKIVKNKRRELRGET